MLFKSEVKLFMPKVLGLKSGLSLLKRDLGKRFTGVKDLLTSDRVCP